LIGSRSLAAHELPSLELRGRAWPLAISTGVTGALYDLKPSRQGKPKNRLTIADRVARDYFGWREPRKPNSNTTIRTASFLKEMSPLGATGRIHAHEGIVEGLAGTPQPFTSMLTGGIFGKTLVRVS
jgi:hypothetical protein